MFPLATQPKSSCLFRPFSVPHVAPVEAVIANSRPVVPVSTKRGVGACAVAAAGAGWLVAIVTCWFALTVTFPPAFAVTST